MAKKINPTGFRIGLTKKHVDCLSLLLIKRKRSDHCFTMGHKQQLFCLFLHITGAYCSQSLCRTTPLRSDGYYKAIDKQQKNVVISSYCFYSLGQTAKQRNIKTNVNTNTNFFFSQSTPLLVGTNDVVRQQLTKNTKIYSLILYYKFFIQFAPELCVLLFPPITYIYLIYRSNFFKNSQHSFCHKIKKQKLYITLSQHINGSFLYYKNNKNTGIPTIQIKHNSVEGSNTFCSLGKNLLFLSATKNDFSTYESTKEGLTFLDVKDSCLQSKQSDNDNFKGSGWYLLRNNHRCCPLLEQDPKDEILQAKEVIKDFNDSLKVNVVLGDLSFNNLITVNSNGSFTIQVIDKVNKTDALLFNFSLEITFFSLLLYNTFIFLLKCYLSLLLLPVRRKDSNDNYVYKNVNKNNIYYSLLVSYRQIGNVLKGRFVYRRLVKNMTALRKLKKGIKEKSNNTRYKVMYNLLFHYSTFFLQINGHYIPIPLVGLLFHDYIFIEDVEQPVKTINRERLLDNDKLFNKNLDSDFLSLFFTMALGFIALLLVIKIFVVNSCTGGGGNYRGVLNTELPLATATVSMLEKAPTTKTIVAKRPAFVLRKPLRGQSLLKFPHQASNSTDNTGTSLSSAGSGISQKPVQSVLDVSKPPEETEGVTGGEEKKVSPKLGWRSKSKILGWMQKVLKEHEGVAEDGYFLSNFSDMQLDPLLGLDSGVLIKQTVHNKKQQKKTLINKEQSNVPQTNLTLINAQQTSIQQRTGVLRLTTVATVNNETNTNNHLGGKPLQDIIKKAAGAALSLAGMYKLSKSQKLKLVHYNRYFVYYRDKYLWYLIYVYIYAVFFASCTLAFEKLYLFLSKGKVTPPIWAVIISAFSLIEKSAPDTEGQVSLQPFIPVTLANRLLWFIPGWCRSNNYSKIFFLLDLLKILTLDGVLKGTPSGWLGGVGIALLTAVVNFTLSEYFKKLFAESFVFTKAISDSNHSAALALGAMIDATISSGLLNEYIPALFSGFWQQWAEARSLTNERAVALGITLLLIVFAYEHYDAIKEQLVKAFSRLNKKGEGE